MFKNEKDPTLKQENFKLDGEPKLKKENSKSFKKALEEIRKKINSKIKKVLKNERQK